VENAYVTTAGEPVVYHPNQQAGTAPFEDFGPKTCRTLPSNKFLLTNWKQISCLAIYEPDTRYLQTIDRRAKCG
jgi:hypothetical protein